MNGSKIHPKINTQPLNPNKTRKKRRYRKIVIRKKIKKKKSSKFLSKWPFLHKLKKVYQKYKKNKKVIFTFFCIKFSVSLLLLVLEIVL